MTLRKKTLLIIGAMFLGLIIILLFISQSILLRSNADLPKDILEQIQKVSATLILSIVAVGIMFGVATVLLLERQVISRLSRLSKSITIISKSGDISARVPTKGVDELSNVAGTINAMLEALEQSEAKLQKLYTDEKTLRQELQDEINKRVEFTRVLVHEIKTPLTPVVTASELLLEEIKDKSVFNIVEIINKGAHNLNMRIDELLAMARGEIGTLQLDLASVNLIQLLQEIARTMQSVVQRNAQNLNLELPRSLPKIWADADRLRQVILNLINNALKFTPTGGTISLRAKKDNANTVVEVQDTGPGISQEDQRWLFEPYYRSERNGKSTSGLGLGLSLSKNLIELHGGQIWVESREGVGSSFYFSVPIQKPRNKREK
jgi:signal transduction histidine kinase